MRFITTQVHGVIDYVVGVLLIAAPWILGFAGGGPESWLPVVIGAAVIAYSLFTDYEYGMVRRITMRMHLWLDAAFGAFLAISPWLLNYWQVVWWPHVIVGLLLIAAALLTQLTPARMHDGEGRGGRPHTV